MAIKKVGVSGSAESRLKVTDDKGKAAKDFKKFQKDVGGKARPAAKPSTTKGNPEADWGVIGEPKLGDLKYTRSAIRSVSSKPVKKSVKASTQRATRRAMGNK